MSGSIPSNLNFGSFVPTTNVWEIQQIQSLNIDPNLKQTLIRLYQNINTIALVLNGKVSGIYDTQEFLTGEIFFPVINQAQAGTMTPVWRPVFCKVINFGPLPNTTTKSIPHDIPVNAGYIGLGPMAFATNSNSTSMISIPFASPTLNENIKIEQTATDIIITTGSDRSDYITTYAVARYLKL